MKKILLFHLALCYSIPFVAQKIKELDIYSIHLDEMKVVKIFLPQGYEKSKHRYPLTLVLDSEALFDSYVATAKLYSKNDATPQQIILGLTNQRPSDKYRDYGYDILNSFPDEHGTNTLKFIKEELIPKIRKSYRVASYKTIVSNQLTANFANYFLFDKKPLFNGYICINPELAPDMPVYMWDFISKLKRNDVYYYLAHGNNIEKKKLDLIDRMHVRLTEISNIYFNYKFEPFKRNNLVTIPQALASAQEYIFSMYSPIGDEEFTKNISFLSSMAAMEYLKYKYENIEYEYGVQLPIRLSDFVRLENVVINQENGKYLKEYGELALEIHPKSPLGNYYIGLYYEKSENFQQALIAYKKGYAKIPENSSRSYGYYMNIKRVVLLQNLEKEEQNSVQEELN